MAPSVITFGEILMRLTTPGYSRLTQSKSFNAFYGGGEANVAAALAQMGLPTAHVTVLPDHDLGRAAAAAFREVGVSDEHFYYGPGRMGLYFMETGAGFRPSRIVYDRYESAFAQLDPATFNWEEILADAQWLHWTGITPAISSAAAQACGQAIQAARKLGLTVSADVNYRRVLWQYGKTPAQVMPELVAGCDVVVCTQGDAADIFNIQSEGFEDMSIQLKQQFPQIKTVLATRRESLSASHNRLTGLCYTHDGYTESPTFDINPIVDRIGGGDAFLAGWIYGELQWGSQQQALAFATAASAWKHLVEGDFNVATAAEILQVVEGDRSGRLLR